MGICGAMNKLPVNAVFHKAILNSLTLQVYAASQCSKLLGNQGRFRGPSFFEALTDDYNSLHLSGISICKPPPGAPLLNSKLPFPAKPSWPGPQDPTSTPSFQPPALASSRCRHEARSRTAGPQAPAAGPQASAAAPASPVEAGPRTGSHFPRPRSGLFP